MLEREGFDSQLANEPTGYGVVTLHRPSNVDDQAALSNVLGILGAVSERLPLIWPVHPRARASIERLGLAHVIDGARVVMLPPQGYLEMVGLMRGATLALTDSGGVQEETTALGIPCLTMRSNTERPITLEQGTNVLVGSDRSRVLAAVHKIMSGGASRDASPKGGTATQPSGIAGRFRRLAGWSSTNLAGGMMSGPIPALASAMR